jgi:carbonic anhydrase
LTGARRAVARHDAGVNADDTFADVLTANELYARGFALAGLGASAAQGLAVLTCMDSRIEPLAMLGLTPGDAKILRNAGGRVTDEVLGTLVVARHLLGVERLMVIAHTNCRMVAADPQELRAAISAAGGPDTESIPFQTTPDQLETLREDVARTRAFEALAGLQVGGFLYDVDTGRVTEVR